MVEYQRNCLSGPGLQYQRTVELNWEGQTHATLSVPSDEVFSRKILREAGQQFQTAQSDAKVTVIFNEPFSFDPHEVTTGSDKLDEKLSAAPTPNLGIGSMVFQATPGAGVKVEKKSITISTGWVQVNGVYAPDFIQPLPIAGIEIEANGSIRFKPVRSDM